MNGLKDVDLVMVCRVCANVCLIVDNFKFLNEYKKNGWYK